jgi:chromate reductase, NAD(P)H dehydrogenase (quinone)
MPIKFASPRILMWSGSQRKDSLNTQLLEQLALDIPAAFQIERLEDVAVQLPLFDQDLEAQPAPLQLALRLHAQVSRCDAIVLASPEYNGQVTPYLKNTVDWMSRLPYLDPNLGNPFLDRPVLLCSASPSWSGGAGGLAHARSLFAYVGAMVLGDTVSVPFADQCASDWGFVWDPAVQERAMFSLSRLLQQATYFKSHRSA